MKPIELKDFLNYRFLSNVKYVPGGKKAAQTQKKRPKGRFFSESLLAGFGKFHGSGIKPKGLPRHGIFKPHADSLKTGHKPAAAVAA